MTQERPSLGSLEETLHEVMEQSPHLSHYQSTLTHQTKWLAVIAGATEEDLSHTVITEGGARGWTGWAVLAFSQWIAAGLPRDSQPNLMAHWSEHHPSATRGVWQSASARQAIPLGDSGQTVTPQGLWALASYVHEWEKLEDHVETGGPSWVNRQVFTDWPAVWEDLPSLWATANALLEAGSWLPSLTLARLARQLQTVLLVDTAPGAGDRDLLDRLAPGNWGRFHDSFAQQSFATQFAMLDRWTRQAPLKRALPGILPLKMTLEEDCLWHLGWARVMVGACQERVPMTPAQVRRQLSWVRANLTDQVHHAKRYAKLMHTPSGHVIAEVLEALVVHHHQVVDVPDWARRYAQLPTTGALTAQALDRLHARLLAAQRQSNAQSLVQPGHRHRLRP